MKTFLSPILTGVLAVLLALPLGAEPINPVFEDENWGIRSSGGTVVGGNGSEATLALLRSYEHTGLPAGFEWDDGPPLTVYVSSQAGGDFPVGNDSNNGLTRAAAFQTIDGALAALSNIGTSIDMVLDAGDTWICDGVLDCGITDTVGLGIQVAPACTKEYTVGFRARGSDPTGARKPVLDFEDITADSRWSGTQAALRSASDSPCITIFENIEVHNLVTPDFNDKFDVVRTDNQAIIVANGIYAEVGGFSNQLYTTHGDSGILALNSSGKILDDGTVDMAGEVYGIVGDAWMVDIGSGTYQLEDVHAEADHRMIRVTGSSEGLFIGNRYEHTVATADDAYGVRLEDNEKVTLVRSLLTGFDSTSISAAVHIRVDTAAGQPELGLYQTTSSGNPISIRVSDSAADALATIRGRCFASDSLVGGVLNDQLHVRFDTDDDLAATVWDVSNSLWDDDDGGSTRANWGFDAAGAPRLYDCLVDTGAGCPNDLGALVVGGVLQEAIAGNFFDNGVAPGVECGGKGTNDQCIRADIYRNANTLNDAYGACTSVYTVDMPSQYPVDALSWVFGGRLSGFRLNTSRTGTIGYQ